MRCVHPVNDASGRRLPCGRCIGCRINRGHEWSLRLLHELDYWDSAVFVTLTYDDEHLPEGGTLVARDLQLFLKRLRLDLKDRRIKYYAVGEYGDNYYRPHYHGIFFGLFKSDKRLIDECWNLGFVYLGSVTEFSINYVTSYIQKKLYGSMAKEVYEGKEAPFARMSKGLGRRWMEENKDFILLNAGLLRGGRFVKAPRYYLKMLGEDFPVEVQNELKRKRAKDRERPVSDEEAVNLWKADKEQMRQIEVDADVLQEIRSNRKF